MARVTFINAIMSGKLAGTTYARNKAGYYVKQWTNPNDPKSNAQIENRAIMTGAASSWHALSDAEKALWNSYATNIFIRKGGGGSPSSGFNAFVALWNSVQHGNRGSRVTTFTAPATTTGVFTGFGFVNTPPIAPLAGAIQTSAGLPLPIVLTGVTLAATHYVLTATFALTGVLVACPKFLDATSSKPCGLVLQMSIPQVQIAGFVQGSNVQTIGVMKTVVLTNAAWTGNIITISMAGNDSLKADFKTAISAGQIVRVSAYLMSIAGEQKLLGSQMVTAT